MGVRRAKLCLKIKQDRYVAGKGIEMYL